MPPEQDVSIWYLWTDKGQAGPYSLRQLRNMLQQGRITPEHNAWREGLAAWTPLGELAEIQAPVAEPVIPPPAARATVAAAAPERAAHAPAAAASSHYSSVRPPRREHDKPRASLLAFIPFRLIIFLAIVGAAGYFAWPYFFPSAAYQSAEKFSELLLLGQPEQARQMAKDEAFNYLLRRPTNSMLDAATFIRVYWMTRESEKKEGDQTNITFFEGLERMPRGGGATTFEDYHVSVTMKPEGGQWKVTRYARDQVDETSWLHKIRRFTSSKAGKQ